MNYLKASSVHTVEETQSMIVIARKKKNRCDEFNHIVEAVLAEYPDAKTHIDSDSGGYDKVIVLK